jgi:phosphoribosylanthranilate isomerase
MTKFKICGLREVGHALAAAEAGADFLGFNFVPGVRRQLGEEQARAIIQEYRRLRGSGGPRLVGLFANQPLEDVNRIVLSCGLDFAQLCGDESLDYCQRVEASVIKQIKVRDGQPVGEVMRRVEEVVSRNYVALLDKHEAGALGGTGRSFDWGIAREVARRYDFLLAGGLSPDNVVQAIAMVNPWGVDVSSGVETDGAKDVSKIVAFAESVRRCQ